jgi:hypothetical protein
MKLKLIILLIVVNFKAFELYSLDFHKGTIDTVISFTPGKGQNIGQSSDYFPQNIFGLPSPNANATTPASSPDEVLSLGLGGEIIVGFKDSYLYDGDGPDFTVFENAFINPINGKVFAEPGIVSVSEDGINFIEFPYDFQTLAGCAGTNPTIGSQDPFDPSVSGGNSFDLHTIGLNRIKYIKIKDITDKVLENPNHKFYDPTLSGFDLDAITARYLIYDNSDVPEVPISGNVIAFINNLQNNALYDFYIYNLFGAKLFSSHNKFDFFTNINNLKQGFYIISIVEDGKNYYFKFLK